MKDKFIIINDFTSEVLNGDSTEDEIKETAIEETMLIEGKSEHLLIYKLYATISPIEIKLVDEAKKHVCSI